MAIIELSKSLQNLIKSSFSSINGLSENYQQYLEDSLSSVPGIDKSQLSEMFEINGTFISIAESMALNPIKVVGVEAGWAKQQAKLVIHALKKVSGSDEPPLITPDKGDRRFSAPEWSENAFFDYLVQAYLLNARTALSVVNVLEDVRGYSKGQYEFYVRQIVSALSPSNFLLTNPELIKKTINTKGQNLWEGFKQFLTDYKKNPKLLNISMTDFSAFQVGRNVAISPCDVIFENDLIQLLQYRPTTESVHKTPLLIVPPFINKYYILDLTQKKSFVKWLVSQGFTVFLISWVNPGPEYRDKGFDDYMLEGPVAAIEQIQKVTGEKHLNAIGYCVGGTLLASTLAWLEKKKKNPVNAVTYLASLLDFSDPGEIGVFINERVVSNIEKWVNNRGYFDGRAMAFSFSLLREKDLFWSFFVNNYLKGEKPVAFDLLFWNSDGTNLPARMHRFYLRHMYLENKLVVPDGIELAGEKINLSKIKTPTYFVSAVEDHIAKWKATYKGMQTQTQQMVKFVLSGSGHIAGIVNPLGANKYGYWTNPERPENPEDWFKKADRHSGSWWADWGDWVNSYAGELVSARIPGQNGQPILEEGPGRYVKESIQEVLHRKKRNR